MSFAVALVLGGSLVYAFDAGNAGALMIAAGCVVQLVGWLDGRMRKRSG